MTNEQFRAIIAANLIDVRITSITLFINRLISRNLYSAGIDQFRLKNTVTDTYIKNMQEFIAAIVPTHLTADFNYNADRMTGNSIHPMVVTFDNIDVNLNRNSIEDELYFNAYGYSSKIQMSLNYLNDADPNLPLKVYTIKLV